MNENGSALITGSAIRVGRSIAINLAQKKYNIALHCNSSYKEALELQQIIKEIGVDCKVFQADLAKYEEVKNLFSSAFEAFPDLNILINNASIFIKKSFLETDEDFFNKNINVNIKAPFFLTQNFAQICKKGNIINISDISVEEIRTGHFIYHLSKKMLSEFSQMVKKDLAPNIKLHELRPDLILAPRQQSSAELDKLNQEINNILQI